MSDNQALLLCAASVAGGFSVGVLAGVLLAAYAHVLTENGKKKKNAKRKPNHGA